MARPRSRIYHQREKLERLAKTCSNQSEILKEFGYKLNSGNYQTLQSTAREFGIILPVWSGDMQTSAARSKNRMPTDKILVKNSPFRNTSHLKARLIREGILVPKCSAPFCPVPNPTVNPFTGEKKELKLSLDHINGDRTDNRLENLRLLCYHCHGETDTWCNTKRN